MIAATLAFLVGICVGLFKRKKDDAVVEPKVRPYDNPFIGEKTQFFEPMTPEEKFNQSKNIEEMLN